MGVPYSFTFTVVGGSGPFIFSISGDVPPELMLDPDTGVLSGTPFEAGTFTFTVTVEDAFGNTSQRQYYIVISEGSDAPVITDGAILLQADDLSWHRVFLFSDDIRIETDQAASPDPGTRGYFIWEADDATRHRTELMLDERNYALRIDQADSAEARDYATLPLALYPLFAVFHDVTLTLDETYTEDVNQTPNP